ncbi:MAG: EamA family transporter [Bacillota bacterium]|nr:EamA family transporter [Bacillota bacterium]
MGNNAFKESLQRNKKGILLMMLASICVCVGQLLWKLYTNVQPSACGMFGEATLLLVTGFAIYATGAIIMIAAYKYGSLSVLQPMLSLNYVISLLLAYFVLNETISSLKIAGILLIILGVVLIGGGDKK